MTKRVSTLTLTYFFESSTPENWKDDGREPHWLPENDDQCVQLENVKLGSGLSAEDFIQQLKDQGRLLHERPSARVELLPGWFSNIMFPQKATE